MRGWTRGEKKGHVWWSLSKVRRISIGGLCWGVCLIVSLFEVSFVGDCLIGAGAASDYNHGRGMLHPCIVCDGETGGSCLLRSQPEAWATIPSNSLAAHWYHMISQLNLT